MGGMVLEKKYTFSEYFEACKKLAIVSDEKHTKAEVIEQIEKDRLSPAPLLPQNFEGFERRLVALEPGIIESQQDFDLMRELIGAYAKIHKRDKKTNTVAEKIDFYMSGHNLRDWFENKSEGDNEYVENYYDSGNDLPAEEYFDSGDDLPDEYR